jgi:flagellar biosynthesis protein
LTYLSEKNKIDNSNNSERTKAAALQYNPEKDSAPIIVASGHGATAEKIIEIAEQNGILVYRDDSAASILSMLDVGRDIPVELYEVVAAIYTQILKTTKDILDKNNSHTDNTHQRGQEP